MVIGHTVRETSAYSSRSLFLPPCFLTYCLTCRHTHTYWHLWLQWLPSGEMKSYFCFQITDCQSNKWICSHQRREIDILFSNFNLFSCEGCCLVGLPLMQLFSSILLAIRQWDVAVVCEKGLIFHLSLPLLENVVKSLSDERLLCVHKMYMNGVKWAATPVEFRSFLCCLSSGSCLCVFSDHFLAASEWKASVEYWKTRDTFAFLAFFTWFVLMLLLYIERCYLIDANTLHASFHMGFKLNRWTIHFWPWKQ